jgi:hypothetical protein
MLKFPGEEVVTLELVHRPNERGAVGGQGHAGTSDSHQVNLAPAYLSSVEPPRLALAADETPSASR